MVESKSHAVYDLGDIVHGIFGQHLAHDQRAATSQDDGRLHLVGRDHFGYDKRLRCSRLGRLGEGVGRVSEPVCSNR